MPQAKSRATHQRQRSRSSESATNETDAKRAAAEPKRVVRSCAGAKPKHQRIRVPPKWTERTIASASRTPDRNIRTVRTVDRSSRCSSRRFQDTCCTRKHYCGRVKGEPKPRKDSLKLSQTQASVREAVRMRKRRTVNRDCGSEETRAAQLDSISHSSLSIGKGQGAL